MQQELDIPHLLISRLTNTATLAALNAGCLLKRVFGTHFDIKSKDCKHDLVTEYDEKVEKLLIEFIQNTFPDHIFLGEESGANKDDPQAIKWIIDPIDGTMNFARGIPIFCISIAATFQNEVLSGVIYDPMKEELFVAEKNGGAFLNGQPLKISETSLLSDSLIATGFPPHVAENPGHCIDHLTQLLKLGLPIRRGGSAALDLAYVAAGRYDGYLEIVLNPWDFAAGSLLVEEAGGKVTSYSNDNLLLSDKSSILASNAILHDHLLSEINSEQAEN